jgi:hypothetical protein
MRTGLSMQAPFTRSFLSHPDRSHRPWGLRSTRALDLRRDCAVLPASNFNGFFCL